MFEAIGRVGQNLDMDLIYTVAFDPRMERYHRLMARILVSSLKRWPFEGQVMVFTNRAGCMEGLGQDTVQEVVIQTDRLHESRLGATAQQWKYRARVRIDARHFDKIMFVDADCIFLRSPNLLLQGNSVIRYAQETSSRMTDHWNNAYFTKEQMLNVDEPGVNSGFFWVRGEHYEEVMAEWERIDASGPDRPKFCGDQPAWNRLLLDTTLPIEPFQYGVDVRYPFIERRTMNEFDEASVLHFNGANARRKLDYMAATYVRHFHPESAVEAFAQEADAMIPTIEALVPVASR